ncbi:nuclease SbcCD subunit D [Paenibacillus sp. NAIST15-1]|nr:nuclease SbcCD subunit D [Paenibacillus sp. NAIST15-1]
MKIHGDASDNEISIEIGDIISIGSSYYLIAWNLKEFQSVNGYHHDGIRLVNLSTSTVTEQRYGSISELKSILLREDRKVVIYDGESVEMILSRK